LVGLAPPLALSVLLARRQSLSLCLQIAVLLGIASIGVLHMSLGDPLTFWQSEVRAIEQTMLQHEMPHAADVSTVLRAFDPFARWFWGLAAAQALLLSMCALFLARKWQASGEQPGAFGAEFRSLRLGLALGVAAAGFVALSAWVANDLVDEIAIVFSVALLLVGLAAAHRFRATSGQHVAWLWVMYIALFSPISPLVIGALVTWGFIDNWLRSSRRAATA
jgi:hypothetical protein